MSGMVLFSGWIAFLAIVVQLGTSNANRCEDNPIGLDELSVFPVGQFEVESTHESLFGTSPAAIVSSSGWCANTTVDSTDPEFVIEFGRIIRICGINTAGVGPSHLENYEVSFSMDGSTFSNAETINRISDQQNDHFYELSAPQRATSIKLTFGTFVSNSCIGNLELYERRGRCGNHPVGVSDPFIIPDSNIDVSSNPGDKGYVRMGTFGNLWCSNDSYNESHLTINLGESMTICALETEGQVVSLNYLDSFIVQFSTDGSVFNDYEENSQVREFINIRNGAREFHYLPSLTSAQYIRIRAVEDSDSVNNFCTKLELYRRGSEVEDSGTCFSEMVPFTTVSANSGTPSAEDIRLNSDIGWCSSMNTGDQYLQIDFGFVHSVCAVAVQGSPTNPSDYPEVFELSFAVMNMNDWVIYSEDAPQYSDREYVISPWDGNAIIKRKLATGVPARSMRFWIREHVGPQACLRVAVYGREAINVTCHQNGTASVNVSLGVLGPEITNLTLNDSTCVFPVSNSEGNFVFQFNLNSCDTRAMEYAGDDYLHFSNTIIGISGSTPGATTLHPDVRFPVKCRYYKRDILNEDWSPLHDVSDMTDGNGLFTFTLGFYMDQNHESPYSGQILELLTPVFGKIKVYTGDPNTVLMVVRAWATPTADRDDANNVTLIDNNCQVVTNDTVPFFYACALNSLEQEFSFRAFSFVVDSNDVYIHADLRVCLNELGNVCTSSCTGCGLRIFSDRKRRSTTESWDANSNANIYSIDFPPLKIKGDQETRDSPQEGNEGLTTTAVVIIVVSGVLALGVIFVTALIIKRRGNPKKHVTDRVGLEPTIQYLPSDPPTNAAIEA